MDDFVFSRRLISGSKGEMGDIRLAIDTNPGEASDVFRNNFAESQPSEH